MTIPSYEAISISGAARQSPEHARLVASLRRETAFHEAGHAIVDVGLGSQIAHAALFDTGDLSGRVRVIDTGNQLSPWAWMAAYLAGPIADELRDPARGDDYDPNEDACDLITDHLDLADGNGDADTVRAMAHAQEVYASEGQALLAMCQTWVRVDKWLRLPTVLVAVEALASMLTKHEFVGGAVIHRLAESHGVRQLDRRLLPRGRPFLS